MKINVLYITISPSPYTIDFLNEIGKNCNLTALFEKSYLRDRHDSWRDFKAKHFEFNLLKGFKVYNFFFGVSVIKYLNNGNYDAVILANPSSLTGIFTIIYLKAKKIPFMLQSEGGMAKSGKGLKEWFKKWLMKDAVLYFSGMSIEREYFLTYGATKERIVKYNFSSFYKKEILKKPLNRLEKKRIREILCINGENVILSVGRFIHLKGFDILIQALKYCRRDIDLYLIGGEPTEEYLYLIEESKLNNVHFIDFLTRREVWDYYRAADLFVLPTREDTWGLVINEAMANGLPVITTDNCVAGLELVTNGRNGFITPVGDELALAKKIDQIISDPVLQANMSANSLNIIKEYTIENMAASHLYGLEQYLSVNNLRF